MINFLEKAKLLPVFDWNICFFGAHYQQVDKNWKVPIEEHKAFECIYVIDGIEEIIMEKDTIYLKKRRHINYSTWKKTYYKVYR